MPKIRLVNPHRSRRRHSNRKARKRRQPAALARYWAAKRRRENAVRHSAGGGLMDKRRRHHRRRRSNSHRRRRRVSRMRNPIFAFSRPRRRRGSHRRRRSNRRRRNPSLTSSFSSLTSGSTLDLVGGGVAGFFGARMIPQNIPFLSSYNSGVPGYLLNIGSGALISWVLKLMKMPRAATGALVGAGVAVVARIITDNMAPAAPSSSAGASASMSGMGSDLDFDLGYYGDAWPFPQGAAAGPYPMFAGNPRAGAAFPASNASAVIAGQQALAVATAAGAGGGAGAPGGPGRWDADRWS
jgi:hypothetical protein